MMFMSVFWILLIAGVIYLVVRAGGQGKAKEFFRGNGSSALDILRERYARGEIDEREFEEKKSLLQT